MKTIKKFLANFTPIRIMRVISVLLTIIGLIEVVTLNVCPHMVWLMSMLNAVLLYLVWVDDD